MAWDGRDKRIGEVSLILDAFGAKFSDILQKHNCSFVDNPATAIVETYELILDGVIKQFIPESSKAQIYKVASGLELATVYKNPIKSPNLTVASQLNVLLAYSIAGGFLLQAQFGNAFPTFTSHFKDECSRVFQNHLELLRYLSIDELYNLPVFSNSIYWQAFELLVRFDLSSSS